MSDRIVVMNRGRIEQVGTPAEIYGDPASPFVADFVGRMNFIEGRLASARVAECKGVNLHLGMALERAPGTPVTVCLRPEDVVVRNTAAANGNVLDADVGVMEFIGNHFSTTLHLLDSNLNLSADFSINDVRDLAIRSGSRIRVALPPERLRAFAAHAA